MPSSNGTSPGRGSSHSRAAVVPAQRQAKAGRPALAGVTELPRQAGRAAPAAVPIGTGLYRIPMASGVWAVSIDESPSAKYPRGLYQLARGSEDAQPDFEIRSQLPYLWARIIRRDGSGDRTDTDYLISADRDGPRVIVSSAKIRRGDWAGAIGVNPSADRKVVDAAGTAIFHMRPLDREYDGEREAIPRSGPDGRVTIPAPETLPPGYLRTGPLGRAEAIAQWRAVIVPAAVANPCFALVLGASAISPFVGWLDYADVRAFIVDLAGEPNAGKSTTARTAGAIWGTVPKDGTGVVGAWNLSAQGPGRALGMLGILPAIFDEQGVSGYSPDQWARIILTITDGSRRAADREGGLRVTLPYSGVVISAGNASIAAGLGAGRYAGIGPKRVNTLTGPFTGSAEQAESVKPVIRDACGWPGRVIMEHFTGADVAALVDQAREMIGTPAGITARSAGKNMHLLTAGAAILDGVFGTGTALRDAAVTGARAYLAQCHDPEHDADRMMTAIRDSMSGQPARWPTVSEYREHKRPRPEYGQSGERVGSDRVDLPQHGIDRDLVGIRADDGSWFAIRGPKLEELVAREGADLQTALAEADKRGWLHIAPSIRKAGKLVTEVKHFGKAYQFALPSDDDRQDVTGMEREPEPGQPEPEIPERCPECGSPRPLHSADCPTVPLAPPEDYDPAQIWDGDGQDVSEPASPAPEPDREPEREPEIPAAIGPIMASPEPVSAEHPIASAVRAYLADCSRSGLANAYHPSADGAVKMINHHGKGEAQMIRDWYARITSETGASPAPESKPSQYVDDGRLGINLPPEQQTYHGPGPESGTVRPRTQAADSAPASPGDQDHEPARERTAPDDAAERAMFAKALRKADAEAAGDDITAALSIFHTVTGGVRWVSYSGQVGQAWFAKLAAQYPSMRKPEPIASGKVREITESGPMTRVNYVAKPGRAVRAGKHHVTSYDLNGQHMAAAGSAELGDGEPEVIESPRSIAGLLGFPGYVRLGKALRTGHPAFGTVPAGQWVAMPLVKFLARDLGLTVPAAEVVYWPKHGRRLSVYASRYRDARAKLMSAERTEPVALALAALKDQANSFIGMFHSETYSHGGFYRPDWYDQIVSTAEANALRALAKCDLPPVAKMADSAYWIAAGSPHTPAGLVISDQLGKWKLDRHGQVSEDLIAAIRDQSPARVRDAVIAINAEREAGR